MLIQIGPCFFKISHNSGVIRCGKNTGIRDPMRINSTCLIALNRPSKWSSLRSDNNSGSPPDNSTSRISGCASIYRNPCSYSGWKL